MVYGAEVRVRGLNDGIADWHEIEHLNEDAESCDHQSKMCDECEMSWVEGHEVRLSCHDNEGNYSIEEYV